MAVVELAELGADPGAVVDRAAAGEELVVTEGGEPLAVVIGVEAYSRLRREREQLRLLALGELEAAAGQGHDLAEVLDDANALLAEN